LLFLRLGWDTTHERGANEVVTIDIASLITVANATNSAVALCLHIPDDESGVSQDERLEIITRSVPA
jgi:hypothetical protein